MNSQNLYDLYSSIEQGIKNIEHAENESRYRDVAVILRGCMEVFDKIVLELLCIKANLPSNEVWNGSKEIHWDKGDCQKDGWNSISLSFSEEQSCLYYREKTTQRQELSGVALRQRAHMIQTPYTDGISFEDYNEIYRYLSEIGSHSPCTLPLKQYLENVYPFKEDLILRVHALVAPDLQETIKQEERQHLKENLIKCKSVCSGLLSPIKEVVVDLNKSLGPQDVADKNKTDLGIALFKDLNKKIDSIKQDLAKLDNDLSMFIDKNASFSVSVTGMNSSGKTTFINALNCDKVFLGTGSNIENMHSKTSQFPLMNFHEIQIQEGITDDDAQTLKRSDIVFYIIRDLSIHEEHISFIKQLRKIVGKIDNIIILINGDTEEHQVTITKKLEEKLGISTDYIFQMNLLHLPTNPGITIDHSNYSDLGYNALIHYLVTYVGEYALKVRQNYVCESYSKIFNLYTSIESAQSEIENSINDYDALSYILEKIIFSELEINYNRRKESLKSDLFEKYQGKSAVVNHNEGNKVIESFVKECVDASLSAVGCYFDKPIERVLSISLSSYPINGAAVLTPMKVLGGVIGVGHVLYAGVLNLNIANLVLAVTGKKMASWINALIAKERIEKFVDEELYDIIKESLVPLIKEIREVIFYTKQDIDYFLEEIISLLSLLPYQMQRISMGLATMMLQQEGYDEFYVCQAVERIVYLPEKLIVMYDSIEDTGKHLIENTIKACYPKDVKIISVPKGTKINQLKQILNDKHINSVDMNLIVKLCRI